MTCSSKRGVRGGTSSRHDDPVPRTRVRCRKERNMATKTKQPPEAAEVGALGLEGRQMPARVGRPSVQRTIEALRAGAAKTLGEGQGVVVARHATHKSALSTASRLRKRHADFEFVADGEEVLARPRPAE